MNRPLPTTLACLFAVVAAASAAGTASADGPRPALSTPAPKPSPDLAKQAQAIADAVLENHIDPPARQQMLLTGIKALYRAAGMPVPAGLGRRVSAVTTTDQLAELLEAAWPKTTAKPVAANALEEALFEGLLASVPGGAFLESAKERKVAEQLEGNRYVGIHIRLGSDVKAKRPKIFQVFDGGPADRAGVKKDDLLERIDGVDTQGMDVRAAVDRLRGEEGTAVAIQVRQPTEPMSRTMTIVRGQFPRETVRGFRKRSAGGWDVRSVGPGPIGYLKISEFTASTPHELRKMERRLDSEGLRALVLDLRGVGGNAVHATVLLADSLLERGPIGRVRTARGESTYQADPDALFRGWPIAVLVDFNTSGTAEWLAAALQDNRRAVIVGTTTSGAQRARPNTARRPRALGVRSKVSVGDGSWSIDLVTGDLERGDGRLLSGPAEDAIDPSLEMVVPREGPGQPVEIETGVKPDLMTGPNPMRPRERPRPGGPSPAPNPGTTIDEPLEKALQWLNQSLKTG